jgi:23S rRNA (cytosine1962-C5)-methyltransferase
MLARVPRLEVPTSLKPSLSRGHPWIYRSQIAAGVDLPSGTWVQVRCGGLTAFGLWDADAPIAVRLFSQRALPDEGWFFDRIAAAWALRAPLRGTATSAYRWLYGESDGLPGIVVDLYGEYAVVQTHARGVEGLVPWVADALLAHTSLLGILWRQGSASPKHYWGRMPPSDLIVEENGLLFLANLMAGQKTGLYLDQRDNRLTLSRWCSGRRVLDCFCYTGAFSLYALRGGASSVTACDAAAEAVESAQRNLTLNGFDPQMHGWVVSDCFDWLETQVATGSRFDLVILDPPSLARLREGRSTAQRAYVRLNRLALGCLRPGGLLATASCTSQISPMAFRQALAEAARQARCRFQILHEAGQPLDHPVAAHIPEARYLKFVLGRVLSPP